MHSIFLNSPTRYTFELIKSTRLIMVAVVANGSSICCCDSPCPGETIKENFNVCVYMSPNVELLSQDCKTRLLTFFIFYLIYWVCVYFIVFPMVLISYLYITYISYSFFGWLCTVRRLWLLTIDHWKHHLAQLKFVKIRPAFCWLADESVRLDTVRELDEENSHLCVDLLLSSWLIALLAFASVSREDTYIHSNRNLN